MKPYRIILVALLTGFLVGICVGYGLTNACWTPPATKSSRFAILVARRDLAIGESFRLGDLEVKLLVKEQVPVGAVTMPLSLEGMAPRVVIREGESIVHAKLASLRPLQP